MKYYYDLHIHTCLSPCADDDMMPTNIAGMARVAGLDVIAVTDHNAVGNVRAVVNASKMIDGPLVIAGMELETSESIHIVVLFETVEGAEEFEKYIWKDCLKVKNRKDIFGNQLLMNENDELIEEKEDLLLVSTNVGVYDIIQLLNDYGGIAVYAHVDREAHGALKILGELDSFVGIKTAEMSKSADCDTAEYLRKNDYRIIFNSDAHSLHQIQDNEGKNYLELDNLSVSEVLKALK